MMITRFFGYSLICGFLLVMLPLTANCSEELITLDTRPGVSQQFLLFEPSGPIQAVVAMFPGHEGEIKFRKDVSSGSYAVEAQRGGFTTRKIVRQIYQDNGLVVALIAPPSDQVNGMDTRFRSSNQHVSDIRTVIDYLREKYKKDVHLHGHCRSSFSPANVATVLRNDGIAGIILSSPRSIGSHGSVTDYERGVVTVPMLLVQHKYDACKGTPYRNLKKVKRFYEQSSSRVDVIIVSGGETESTGPSSCQNRAHSFDSFQKETAQAIADWVNGNEFPTSIPN